MAQDLGCCRAINVEAIFEYIENGKTGSGIIQRKVR